MNHVSEFAAQLTQFTEGLAPDARILNLSRPDAGPDYPPDDSQTVEPLDVSRALSFVEETPYDGIWAPFSLNYIPPVELFATLSNLRHNLRGGGQYGALFITTPEDQVVEQTLRGDYYRSRYPAELVLKLHRQAGLKPTATVHCSGPDGGNAIFLLAL